VGMRRLRSAAAIHSGRISCSTSLVGVAMRED
jgi:hypothetical protein